MKKGNIEKIYSGDYYVINGRKIPNDDPNLLFDYTTGKYVLKNDYNRHYFIRGIVEIMKNGKLRYGEFIRDKFVNITMVLHNGSNEIALDYSVVQNNYNYRENLSNGYFYYYKIIKAVNFRQLRDVQRDEKNALPYSLNGNYQREFENKFEKTNLKIRPGVRSITNAIEGLSFGLEFETINGFIPPRLSGEIGLVPLRDGSIAGIEYATIPLSGDKGVEALLQSVEMLDQRTSINETCSMHLHLGNIPRTKKFIMALYLIVLFIQDDMFEHFPVTKRFNWGIKNKNYNKPYDVYDVLLQLDKNINANNIKKNFNFLLNKLAMGNMLANASLRDINAHPNDPTNQHKWQVRPRYHWVNFMPLVFVNKKTVEFRIHTPTFNKSKVISYLILCSGIVNYTKRNMDSILSKWMDYRYFTIDNILNELPKTNATLKKQLLQYFRERKHITKILNAKGEVKGKEEEIWSFDLFKSKDGEISEFDEYRTLVTRGAYIPQRLKKYRGIREEGKKIVYNKYYSNKIPLRRNRGNPSFESTLDKAIKEFPTTIKDSYINDLGIGNTAYDVVYGNEVTLGTDSSNTIKAGEDIIEQEVSMENIPGLEEDIDFTDGIISPEKDDFTWNLVGEEKKEKKATFLSGSGAYNKYYSTQKEMDKLLKDLGNSSMEYGRYATEQMLKDIKNADKKK